MCCDLLGSLLVNPKPPSLDTPSSSLSSPPCPRLRLFYFNVLNRRLTLIALHNPYGEGNTPMLGEHYPKCSSICGSIDVSIPHTLASAHKHFPKSTSRFNIMVHSKSLATPFQGARIHHQFPHKILNDSVEPGGVFSRLGTKGKMGRFQHRHSFSILFT
jgi:hypothetical protein